MVIAGKSDGTGYTNRIREDLLKKPDGRAEVICWRSNLSLLLKTLEVEKVVFDRVSPRPNETALQSVIRKTVLQVGITVKIAEFSIDESNKVPCIRKCVREPANLLDFFPITYPISRRIEVPELLCRVDYHHISTVREKVVEKPEEQFFIVTPLD